MPSPWRTRGECNRWRCSAMTQRKAVVGEQQFEGIWPKGFRVRGTATRRRRRPNRWFVALKVSRPAAPRRRPGPYREDERFRRGSASSTRNSHSPTAGETGNTPAPSGTAIPRRLRHTIERNDKAPVSYEVRLQHTSELPCGGRTIGQTRRKQEQRGYEHGLQLLSASGCPALSAHGQHALVSHALTKRRA
jgi:hypothetical protein